MRTLVRAIAASLLFAAVVAWGTSAFQTPRYEATAVMLVSIAEPRQHSGGPSAGQIHPLPNLGAGVPGLQTFTLTVAKAVPTMPIARAVVEQLNLPKGSAGKVLENMSVEPAPREAPTRIKVSYEASDAKMAQGIANAIGRVVTQKIGEVSLGDNVITATVREPATLPSTPVSPKPLRNGLIALVIGLAISAVLIVGREFLGR